MSALSIAFVFAAILCFLAAVCSALRGSKTAQPCETKKP
jgi:hypothetical protein